MHGAINVHWLNQPSPHTNTNLKESAPTWQHGSPAMCTIFLELYNTTSPPCPGFGGAQKKPPRWHVACNFSLSKQNLKKKYDFNDWTTYVDDALSTFLSKLNFLEIDFNDLDNIHVSHLKGCGNINDHIHLIFPHDPL